MLILSTGRLYKGLCRRLSTALTVQTAACASINSQKPLLPLTEQRKAILKALQSQVKSHESFTTESLHKLISDFTLNGDYSMAKGLLCKVGACVEDFDTNLELTNFLLAELLAPPDASSETLTMAIDIVESARRNRGDVPRLQSSLSLLFERLCESGADQQMDKLLPQLLNGTLGMTLTTNQMIDIISLVYIRSRRFKKACELLQQLQKTTPRDVPVALWRELFDAVMQPDLTKKTSFTEQCLRPSDRDFVGLSQILITCKDMGIKFDDTFMEALDEVLMSTSVPKKFMAFLVRLGHQIKLQGKGNVSKGKASKSITQ